MVLSMTAYARRERETEFGLLSWELRSVNHRYSEVALRLPEDLRPLEPKARETLAQTVRRGKVDAVLRLQAPADQGPTLDINAELAQQLSRLSRTIDGFLYNPAPISSLEVLRWPGVLVTPERNLDGLDIAALDLLKEALDELIATRRREGDSLRQSVEARLTDMETQLAIAAPRVPEMLDKQRARLRERLAELKTELSADRIEQEIALLAQRLDVSEELERTRAHIAEVRRVLDQDEAIGRRLDFLMQELNREANTLGSKSADIELTRAAVELKVLIEQMREQIQNIE
jgi:uncharacterized protein (TIGR00255 family)